MSELFLFIGLILALIALIVSNFLNYKQINKVLDRAKAKDLEEFKYHEIEYPKEVQHKNETLKEQRKLKKKKAPSPDPKDVKAEGYARRY